VRRHLRIALLCTHFLNPFFVTSRYTLELLFVYWRYKHIPTKLNTHHCNAVRRVITHLSLYFVKHTERLYFKEIKVLVHVYFFNCRSGARPSPLGLLSQMGLLYQPLISDPYGALAGENLSSWRTICPRDTFPSQIPHELHHYRTGVSALRSQRPTSWVLNNRDSMWDQVPMFCEMTCLWEDCKCLLS
jgi:hypothetical protein